MCEGFTRMWDLLLEWQNESGNLYLGCESFNNDYGIFDNGPISFEDDRKLEDMMAVGLDESTAVGALWALFEKC